MSKKIVVIGGGPAGIEAAKAAALSGASVKMVTNSPVGGRAGWHSLLPSKVWLTAADRLGLVQESEAFGLTVSDDVTAVPSHILQRLKQVKGGWNEQQLNSLTNLGVQIISGTAVFTSSATIDIQNKEGQVIDSSSADAFIVTSGSVPIFPSAMKPNGKRIIAPRFASGLAQLPSSMIVVGGGATGSEFAYLFNRLGVDVTWVVDEQGVLPDFDSAAGQFLMDIFIKRGVKILLGQRARKIEETDTAVQLTLADGSNYEAEMAFLAIGRKPDVGNLNLEATGLTVEEGTVVADGYGRSLISHIYVAGDATGAPMTANKAMAEGWIAGKHAAGKLISPLNIERHIVSAFYTEPQVAQVGQIMGETVRLPYHAGMKPQLGLDEEGFVKLAYDGGNGRLLGGVAVGHHAADLLAPVAVAIQAEMTIQQFGMIYGAHPTISELAFMAARLAT